MVICVITEKQHSTGEHSRVANQRRDTDKYKIRKKNKTNVNTHGTVKIKKTYLLHESLF